MIDSVETEKLDQIVQETHVLLLHLQGTGMYEEAAELHKHILEFQQLVQH